MSITAFFRELATLEAQFAYGPGPDPLLWARSTFFNETGVSWGGFEISLEDGDFTGHDVFARVSAPAGDPVVDVGFDPHDVLRLPPERIGLHHTFFSEFSLSASTITRFNPPGSAFADAKLTLTFADPIQPTRGFSLWYNIIPSPGAADPTGFTIHLTPIPVPQQVPLDIRPGSCPNPLNRKSRGKLPVALLGTEDFDVATADLASLQLSRADGVGASVAPLQGPPGHGPRIKEVGTPAEGEPCDCHEQKPDGIDDLLMKFSTADVVANLELAGATGAAPVELVLSGNLQDGTPFAGTDCVKLVGPADVDGDNDVDGADFLTFAACYNGPARAPLPTCPSSLADIDGDGDVDHADCLTFATCFNGPNTPPRCR